jgi:hypothetical protein
MVCADDRWWVFPGAFPVAPVSNGRPEPDPAEALELREELLIACREVLLGVGTPPASVLSGHIDALLDVDDERSPGSQR